MYIKILRTTIYQCFFGLHRGNSIFFYAKTFFIVLFILVVGLEDKQYGFSSVDMHSMQGQLNGKYNTHRGGLPD